MSHRIKKHAHKAEPQLTRREQIELTLAGVGFGGLTLYGIKAVSPREITPENSSRQYAVYMKAWGALRTLIPPDLGQGWVIPKLWLHPGSPDDGEFEPGRSTRYRDIIRINESQYDATDAALDDTLSHELGHWLAHKNLSLAEEISGINLPVVKPLLDELKVQIADNYPTKAQQERVYDNYKSELIADGIDARTACDPRTAEEYFRENIKTRSKKFNTSHPPEESRIDFIRRIAGAFCSANGPLR